MKKIIPFKKEIMFKTNLSEITSISLEHNLHIENDNLISGSFIISGEYKIADTSINTEKFNFDIPFDINVDDKYLLDNVVVDIDDFYYEIVNNKSLEVNIDVLIDKLVEKPLIEKKIDNEENSTILENETKEEDNDIMERCIDPEDILEKIDNIDEEIEQTNNTENNNKINTELIKSDLKQDNINLINNLNNTNQIDITTKSEIKSVEKINSLFDSLDVNSETYKTYKVFIMRNGDNIESIMQKYSITREELEMYNNLSDLKIGDKLIIPDIKNEKV